MTMDDEGQDGGGGEALSDSRGEGRMYKTGRSLINEAAVREGIRPQEMRERIYQAVSNLQPCPVCDQVHARETRITVGVQAGSSTGELMPTCSGHKKDGTPCSIWPVKGGTVCKRHGASLPKTIVARRKRLTLEAIRDELKSLGGQIDVEPTEAMLSMVREAAYNVVYLRALVQELDGRVDDGEGQYVVDDDGVTVLSPAYLGAGIAVRTSPDDWKADYHVLVKMYNEERDRLTRYAKMCRDAGVQERQVQIAEEQGRWLVRTIDAVLEQLGLTERQQEALPVIMGQVLEQLTS